MAHVTFTSLEKLIELLRSAPVNQGTYVRVLGPSQLGLGSDPLRPSHTLDLAREAMVHHFDDETPMDLGPSSINGMDRSTTNGGSSSNHDQHQSKNEHQKEMNPAAQKSNTKLMERLETATNGKRA
jgi:hypothetical protein